MKLVEQFIDLMAWFLQGPRPRTPGDGVQGMIPVVLTKDSNVMNESTQTMEAPASLGVLSTYLRVTHAGGLTLRMAGEIVRALQPLDVQITLIYAGVIADARSILSLVCLAAGRGARVYVSANGPDTARAVEILSKAFAGGFGVKSAPI
jgi:phosphocarrier protein HPr